jgi:hypothetical protein
MGLAFDATRPKRGAALCFVMAGLTRAIQYSRDTWVSGPEIPVIASEAKQSSFTKLGIGLLRRSSAKLLRNFVAGSSQ